MSVFSSLMMQSAGGGDTVPLIFDYEAYGWWGNYGIPSINVSINSLDAVIIDLAATPTQRLELPIGVCTVVISWSENYSGSNVVSSIKNLVSYGSFVANTSPVIGTVVYQVTVNQGAEYALFCF